MSFSSEDKLREALVVPRRRLRLLPDSTFLRRPDWVQLTTPSVTSGGMNEVTLAVLDEADADRVIDETLAHYRGQGLRFRWCVGPDSRPLDLGERLARRGLTVAWTRAMVHPTGGLGAVPGGITVEPVTRAVLPLYSRIMAEGWAMPIDEIERSHRTAFDQEDSPVPLFLARVDGEPAGVGAYAVHPCSAYLLSGVVLPRLRRRGVYRALVDARLRHAASRGLALATVQAMESSSAPILERFGFETVCRFPVYVG